MFLSACPSALVKQIDESYKHLDTLSGSYKPNYLKGKFSFKKGSDINFDSLIQLTEINRIKGLNHHQGTSDTSNLKINSAAGTIKADSTIDTLNTLQKPIFFNTYINSLDIEKYPNLVEIKAQVYDNQGNYITGLAKPYLDSSINYRKFWRILTDSCLTPVDNNFDVTQNDRNQVIYSPTFPELLNQDNIHSEKNPFYIEDFDVTEIREEISQPHSISFVLDHSPSMGHQRAQKLQQAVRKVLYAVEKRDYISVIKFTNKMTNEVALTNDANIYRAGIKTDGLTGRYGSGTAIYDAVARAIYELEASPEGHNKIIVLFSDGGDNSSKIRIDSVQRLAKSKNVKIYTIAYGLSDNKPLLMLSDFTGGKFYQIYSSKEFPYVFYDIYFTLKNYYLIKYRPPDCNSLHKVTLELSLPDSLCLQSKTVEWYDKQSLFTPADPIGTVVLFNIEFEFGKSLILPESMPKIKQVYQTLMNNPNLKLEISGHTDDIGSDEVNLKLSNDRAKAVYLELIKMGIESSRLETKGFGESKPIAENNSEENRKRNRRTEFKIIAK